MAGRSCGGRRAAAASNWAGEGCQRAMSTSHRRTPLVSSSVIAYLLGPLPAGGVIIGHLLERSEEMGPAQPMLQVPAHHSANGLV